jgi:hypothetical protein
MKNKIFIVIFLLIVVFGVIYGGMMLAPTKSQRSNNQYAQDNTPVLPMPSLKKDTPKQKEITDSSGITIRLGGIDPKTKVFKKTSPCELIITDPQGRRVGYDPISRIAYKEIPRAYYEAIGLEDAESGDPGPETKELDIPQPLAGDYQLQVVGTDTGSYRLSIRAYDPELNPSIKKFRKISITPGEVHSYSFYYARKVGAELEFTAVPGEFDGKGQRPKVK